MEARRKTSLSGRSRRGNLPRDRFGRDQGPHDRGGAPQGGREAKGRLDAPRRRRGPSLSTCPGSSQTTRRASTTSWEPHPSARFFTTTAATSMRRPFRCSPTKSARARSRSRKPAGPPKNLLSSPPTRPRPCSPEEEAADDKTRTPRPFGFGAFRFRTCPAISRASSCRRRRRPPLRRAAEDPRA